MWLYIFMTDRASTAMGCLTPHVRAVLLFADFEVKAVFD